MMYQHFNKQSHPPIKTYRMIFLVSLLSISSHLLADAALMHPVQDIHFQELPPPWALQPTSKIITANTATNTIERKAKTVITPAVQTKKPINQQALPSHLAKATKQTYIQSIISAANQNNIQAQYDLGMRYQYGNGVTKSRSKAHRWLNKSANAGHVPAEYALSLFYQKYARNQQGVKKALLWLKKAADHGLADAQYSLGMMFKNGSLVYSNPAESKKWLQMAASQGHVSAQLALQ